MTVFDPSYVQAPIINLSVVTAMVPIMVKKIKVNDDSVIKEHPLFCNNFPDFNDFSILTINSNNFKVSFMENLTVDRNHLLLNKS